MTRSFPGRAAAWARAALAALMIAAATPTAGQEAAWPVPAELAGDRVAVALRDAGGDPSVAEAALEALRRRPPEDAEDRARHHHLAGVALRIVGVAEDSREAISDAAISFLRAAIAGPPGGPLHGPALLEAAITLRLLGTEDTQAAADRLLLEAEPLLRRADDPATLARFEAARP